jgi:hypothetical protein
MGDPELRARLRDEYRAQRAAGMASDALPGSFHLLLVKMALPASAALASLPEVATAAEEEPGEQPGG